MEELQALYDSIKEVVTHCDNMGFKHYCMDNLKEKYNNLCETEEEKI
tara:strand:+ start:1958 stop:2098 length:141 start_codon:yes stop_codon:yes gene_type:complete